MINFGFLLLFLIGLTASHLNNPPVFVKLGETINMSCSYQSQMAMHFSWYKHKLGQNPRLISTIYKYDNKARFYHNFQNSSRFSVLNDKGVHHLVIRNIQLSDSATYYCGSAYSNVMEFVEGTELIVEGLKSYTVIKQPALIPSHRGDSESEKSRSTFIAAHGTSIGQCEWSSEAGFRARRCVYSFSKKDLKLSDSGTYNCTVAACGEMLFWNDTKLDIIGADLAEQMMTFVILSIVRTFLLLITIATITFWYCMNSKRISKDGCSPSAIAFRDRQSRPEDQVC
ncbi:uncharacterized protein [Sinocyclocheilus grahami]|uniref:uncharacterized protein n=1 Tax=Sinocyclocheilus grahami TaxID=75366 RepID=UPI0007AD3846|nr:PREDICTED: uncharacterized protein LOC107603125 [Sinocyclocheilus grahami]